MLLSKGFYRRHVCKSLENFSRERIMLVCEGRTEVAYVLFATPLLDRRSSESTVSRGRNFTPQQREEPDNVFKLSSFRQVS